MNDPGQHTVFVDQAVLFKAALKASHQFTSEEIAAMLGAFVLCGYPQRLITEMPPEWTEYITKGNVLQDRLIAEDGS